MNNQQQPDKPESFQRLRNAIKELFAVPEEELVERLREEKRNSRKRNETRQVIGGFLHFPVRSLYVSRFPFTFSITSRKRAKKSIEQCS